MTLVDLMYVLDDMATTQEDPDILDTSREVTIQLEGAPPPFPWWLFGAAAVGLFLAYMFINRG